MKQEHSPAISTRHVAPDTESLCSHVPAPGLGILPVNAFVIRAAEPVVVDAGVVAQAEAFLEGLGKAIDLDDVRWIWLTHTDPDHTGCLTALLDAAPRARLVTTYLGMGKLGLRSPVPPDRVFLLNPGQRLDVGDRELLAVRPPTFDAPETTGVFDSRTRALFTADSFGAVLSQPAESAADVPAPDLGAGLVTWTGVDAPWLRSVTDGAFHEAVEAVLRLDPSAVLSSHLPAAPGEMTSSLVGWLERARSAEPFVGPDQKALRAMLEAA
jgi:glyoxylase-like metal-dependent hydrolase (beta-lactamase superfamily II)